MKINIGQVRRVTGETVHYDLREELPQFQFGSENISFPAPVHVQIQVHNTGKLLFARGVIEAELRVSCSRCLEEFNYPMKLSFEDEFIFASQATEEQRETAFLYEKDEIEIGERILEHLILSLPMKFICSPECRGLCPECGVNLNRSQCQCAHEKTDSRWADLAKLELGD